MSRITSHVLDLVNGVPALGVRVELERKRGNAWVALASRVTDGDGRVRDLLPAESALEVGAYRLRFHSGEYFAKNGVTALHPMVEIVFEVRDIAGHYHIPLLVTPHAYSTYRGS
ncbi:MAG TPA: hydroxyisourate hydrolase [Acidobacteriaceae bacterium]|nr:hydroxyisourate hydrolase [Acidobacteriaceae bacterium]